MTEWIALSKRPDFEDLEEPASEMLRFVVGLVADPVRLESVAREAERDWQRIGSHQRWDSINLDYGPLAAALFCVQMEEVEPRAGWAGLADYYLSHIEGLDAATGLSPILSPLALGSVLALRYEYDVARRDADGAQELVEFARTRLPPLVQDRKGLTPGRFDFISGLSGTSLLIHALMTLRIAGARQVHSDATRALQALAGFSPHRGGTPLPYWIEPENLPSDEHRATFPRGCTDLGVAHGIGGPLLALSILPDTHKTASQLVDVYQNHAIHSDPAVWWPNGIGRGVDTSTKDRFAWCYGTPGIARALFLASRRMGHSEGLALAVRAAEGVADRIVAGQCLPDPGLCHGTAGLLQIMLRFGADLNGEAYRRASAVLIRNLYHQFDRSARAGFVARTPNGQVSSPCLFNGALGVGLALLGVVEDVEPRWDRLLGLSIADMSQDVPGPWPSTGI